MAPCADDELYAEGAFICVLTPVKEPNTYGILVKKVLRGALWGTCIMYNPEGKMAGNTWGTIVTLGDKALKLAWDRVNNKDETSPYKKHVPGPALRDLLAQGKKKGEVFEAAITACEQRFANELALRTNARRTAPRKTTPAPSKPFVTYMKNAVPYPIGTKVYAHFKWKELFISKEDGQRRSKLPGCTRTGRDYVGTVTKYVENDNNINRNYTCMFATPSKHILGIDEKHLTPLIDAYNLLEDESSDDGLSSPDKDVSVNQPRKKIPGCTGSSVSATMKKMSVVPPAKATSLRPDLRIGTDVTRWVTKADLIAMGHTEQVDGLWIDGLICEVRKTKRRRGSPTDMEYDITFALPPLWTNWEHVNKWYLSAETHDMTVQYQQRHDPKAAANDTSLTPPREQQSLGKSSKQVLQVKEACYVSRRGTRRTKSLLIPQTPTVVEDSHSDVETTTGLEMENEASREDWDMNDPRDRLRFEIEEALANRQVEQEIAHLAATAGTLQDSGHLQHRRNLLSFHMAGGDIHPQFVGNGPSSGTKKFATSLTTSGHPPPPPPLPETFVPSVDYIVSTASPSIARTVDGNVVLEGLSDVTKQHLQKLGLTQLRNGKILPATAEESRNEQLDNAALSLLYADKRLVFVPRDGNCMFNALAICYGGIISPATIRQEAVAYVIAHWDDPEFPFGEFVRNMHPEETRDTYTRRLLPPGKDWGDYPELVGAANKYRHHLYILDLDSSATWLQPHYIEAEDLLGTATTHYVVRVGDNHYHAGAELIASLNQG